MPKPTQSCKKRFITTMLTSNHNLSCLVRGKGCEGSGANTEVSFLRGGGGGENTEVSPLRADRAAISRHDSMDALTSAWASRLRSSAALESSGPKFESSSSVVTLISSEVSEEAYLRPFSCSEDPCGKALKALCSPPMCRQGGVMGVSGAVPPPPTAPDPCGVPPPPARRDFSRFILWCLLHLARLLENQTCQSEKLESAEFFRQSMEIIKNHAILLN